uniref:Chymotrypsin-like protease 1 n=1 Tax=Nemopilema nomurai TaxID=321803 RepID=A0A1B2LPB9_9CNID|nr:chymotrypsin-like protease 1 [Nemopilema nomurai]AOA32905.1 chymotrypsin-like protease 1 [Nemopilema nomurai]
MLAILILGLFVGSSLAQQCGVPRYAASRVIGGSTARPGSWPWQVAIYYDNRFHCGGSLVNANWVVTAAHCLDRTRMSGFTIVLGEHYRQQKEGSEQYFKAKRAFTHPQYNKQPLDSDIALIKLDRPAQFNNRVQPVCLPSTYNKPLPGTTCFITGWGKTSHPGSSAYVLQQSPLPVVDNRRCHALNKPNTRIGIAGNMLCAGFGPNDIRSGCHGDSGGPFVCKSGSQWSLQGAVSWGSGRCNTRDAYTVFARVTNFVSWINKYIKY